jgi:hypothetical protein
MGHPPFVVLPAVSNTNRGLIENSFLISHLPALPTHRGMKRVCFFSENRTRDPLQRGQGGKQGEGLGINPKMSERRRRATSLRPFPNKPKVTSETVPPAQNSVPAPLSDPGADIPC